MHMKKMLIISHQGNANQNDNITFTATRMALISKRDINKCWVEYGKTGTLIHG